MRLTTWQGLRGLFFSHQDKDGGENPTPPQAESGPRVVYAGPAWATPNCCRE